MRTILVFLVNVVMLLGISCVYNKQSQTEQSDTASAIIENSLTEQESVVQMLKEFYTEYITASCQIPHAGVAQITEKYCTPELLNNLHNVDNDTVLDADPFLNAQDCDLKTLETLQIDKDVRPNVYNVTYYWPTGDLISIRLLVIETENGYKIDAILKV